MIDTLLQDVCQCLNITEKQSQSKLESQHYPCESTIIHNYYVALLKMPHYAFTPRPSICLSHASC